MNHPWMLFGVSCGESRMSLRFFSKCVAFVNRESSEGPLQSLERRSQPRKPLGFKYSISSVDYCMAVGCLHGQSGIVGVGLWSSIHCPASSAHQSKDVAKAPMQRVYSSATNLKRSCKGAQLSRNSRNEQFEGTKKGEERSG